MPEEKIVPPKKEDEEGAETEVAEESAEKRDPADRPIKVGEEMREKESREEGEKKSGEKQAADMKRKPSTTKRETTKPTTLTKEGRDNTTRKEVGPLTPEEVREMKEKEMREEEERMRRESEGK